MHSVDSDDDVYGEVGFMFDSALPKARRVFRFDDIAVTVHLVDDDPGAVQSGHYVWPAAPALCSYLVQNWQWMPHGRVLELGAGCGLAGLVAAALTGSTAVIFTDHDPGVLNLIRTSIVEQDSGSFGQRNSGKDIAAKCRCVPLSWGLIGPSQHATLAEALASICPLHTSSTGGVRCTHTAGSNENSADLQRSCRNHAAKAAGDHGTVVGELDLETRTGAIEGGNLENEGAAEAVPLENAGDNCCGSPTISFDLVIASDVIYSVSVVALLFQTISDLLSQAPGSRSTECRLGGVVPRREGESTGIREELDPRLSTEASADYANDGSPVFVMCQSFSYDAETERAIDSACSEHRLARAVVWDELPLAGHDALPGAVAIECADRHVAKGDIEHEHPGQALWQRAGTKLQLFWRKHPMVR